MIEWNYIVVLLCLMLLFFLLWKEISRINKSRLLWRMVTTIGGVACLACIALPVHYNTTEKVDTNKKAVILTEGFNTDSVSRFINANAGTPVIFFDKNIKWAERYNAHYVAEISLLPRQYKDIRLFHVFGYGFNKEELNGLQQQALILHAPKLPPGITSINWQRKLHSGDKLVIQGSYNNTTDSKAKLVLSNFDAVLDSIFITAKDKEAFTLTTVPKNMDKTTYALAVIANKDTIEKETIPLQVEKGEQLKVLMLASSPDFDNKFIKSQLSQDGYVVAARTIISKDKYAFDYLNTSSLKLYHITSSLLDKFDITIADAEALSAIPKSELAALQSAVAQKGMGLIIKADSIAAASFYTSPFPLSSISENTKQLTTYLLDTVDKMPALTTDYPISIRDQVNAQPLVYDKQNKAYVSSALYGSGKIVFTTLTNTYTWPLSGNEEAYKRYWATLLNKAATKPSADETWSVSPALPVINTPVQLQLQTSSTGIPQGEVNGTSVYLESDPGLPYQWSGTYYPRKQGWQTAIGLNGAPFYWYAFNNTDWQNVYAADKITTTQHYIYESSYKQNNSELRSIIKEIDFPKIYFFILLLMCCSFLWVESKYSLAASN